MNERVHSGLMIYEDRTGWWRPGKHGLGQGMGIIALVSGFRETSFYESIYEHLYDRQYNTE